MRPAGVGTASSIRDGLVGVEATGVEPPDFGALEPARAAGPERPIQNGALRAALRPLWRLIILVVGSTVVLIGVAMLVLPGPAIVVIPAGLAILATEFAWAKRLLDHARERFQAATAAVARRAKRG